MTAVFMGPVCHIRNTASTGLFAFLSSGQCRKISDGEAVPSICLVRPIVASKQTREQTQDIGDGQRILYRVPLAYDGDDQTQPGEPQDDKAGHNMM